MKRFATILLSVLVLTAANVKAEAPSILTPAQYDPARILPPPPVQGSPRAQAEITELDRIAAVRTRESFAAAKRDAANETGTMFAPVLGHSFDLKALPATAKMLDDIIATEEVVTKVAKDYFKRARPWIVDTSLTSCEPHKPGPALNSYPSGHATVAFSMGVVLASLIPDKAQAILARSEEFAENRLVCGMHFRSDIVAGQTLGTLIATNLMQNPAFKPEYNAAAAELRTAHLIH